MTSSDLSARVKSIPTGPGVYLFKDEKGKVVYVGKAANLRNRVRSYFSASPTRSPKLAHLARTTADFEFIVTESDMEALVLECSLIKRYRPRYNVVSGMTSGTPISGSVGRRSSRASRSFAAPSETEPSIMVPSPPRRLCTGP